MLLNSCWSAGCYFHSPAPLRVQPCTYQHCVSEGMIWIWLQRGLINKNTPVMMRKALSRSRSRTHTHTHTQATSPNPNICIWGKCDSSFFPSAVRPQQQAQDISSMGCVCRCCPIFLKSNLTNGREHLLPSAAHPSPAESARFADSVTAGYLNEPKVWETELFPNPERF